MTRTVRDVHSGHSKLARYRAERLLRGGYAQLRSRVLAVVRSKLRAAGVWLDEPDLEACYSQAWQGLYREVLAGKAIESPEGWLVLVTFRRAIDEARAVSRARPGVEEDVARDAGATGGAEPDMAGALDDRERLRSLFEGLRARLSARECQAASLCYLQGLSRAEAATRMGISERRMDKLMEGRDGVAGRVGELLDTIKAGGWCEQQSSLMRAYAFGILAPEGERHTLAVAHTRKCPACRARVAALRGLASVLPPLPLPFASPRASAGAPSRPRAAGTRRAPRQAISLRPHPRVAASSGWLSGGRLIAQIAVSGALALGGGYALLSARARGGALHPPAPGAASQLKRTVSAPGALLTANSKHARVYARPSPQAGSARRASASHRSTGAGPARAPTRLPAQEFSPERARSQGRAAPTPAAAQREFGIE